MFVFAMGACCGCSRAFSFHPNKVPSLVVNGKREPLCRSCFDRGQAIRAEHGVDPWPEPLPGAYEGADESEINWNDNRTLP